MIRKKSQTEIMGLMIIVVIMTLIILFVISVVYFKPTDDPLNSFMQKDLSTSIISAMLKTDSGCTKDTTLEDLLIDIASKGQYGTITCDPDIANVMEARYSIITIDGEQVPNEFCQSITNSRDALECGLSQILYSMQQDVRRPYHLLIKTGDTKLLTADEFSPTKFMEEEFSRATSVDVTPYTLPLYPSANVLEIWLCIGGECPDI
jgi:hypothetical protein